MLKRVFTPVGCYIPYEHAFILRSKKYILKRCDKRNVICHNTNLNTYFGQFPFHLLQFPFILNVPHSPVFHEGTGSCSYKNNRIPNVL